MTLPNEFEPLRVQVPGLKQQYELGYRFLNTDGPEGAAREPYLLMLVSFSAPSGKTLHYALQGQNGWPSQLLAMVTDSD
jgi:hypothetical protein